MPYNTDFYGENGYRLTTMSTANVDIYCANFNGNGNEVSGQLKSGVLADKFAVGEDLDGSIQTHGIPPYGDWNTLNDYGGFGYLGIAGENLIHDIAPTPSAPILWCFHRRSNNTYAHGYCQRKVKLDDVLWGADKTLGTNDNTNVDATSLVPIVQMDYKNFFVVPFVLCSSIDYGDTVDEYGRYNIAHNEYGKTCYAISLDTYLKSYWDTYPTVHGIFYVTYLCRWISQDPQTMNPLPVFNYTSSLLNNGITPIINKKFGFSTDTIGGPTDGTIVATGSDFCSPWLPANGVVLNFTRTEGTESQNAPSSGNFMYVLGCNTNTSAARQTDYGSSAQYVYDGVTPAYGFSHLRMIKSNTTAYSIPLTKPVWFDKPTNKADFKEAVHKMMSWLAIPWADEVGGVETGETPVYIGTLDDNGIATGEYVTVTNPDEVPQMASDDFINDNHYDPGYDPTKDIDDPYEFPSVMRTGFGKFEHAYLLNDHYVEELHTWFYQCNKYALYPPSGVDPDAILKEYKNCAYGESPIDGVVSLMVFPTISMEWLLPTGSSLNYLHLGTLMTNQIMGVDIEGDQAKPMGYKIGESSGLVPFTGTASSILWQPYFNDFRDYAPYTSAELVIPYHGSVQLDPADWLGRLITIKYVVDIRTGVSTALVCREGIPMLSVDGQVGIPVPVHATDAASMINSQVQNAFQMKSAELQKTAAITDMVFGTAQAATTGAAGIQKVGADLNATQGQIGAAVGGAMIGTLGAVAKGINGVRSANLSLEKAKQEMSHIPVTRMSVGSASSTVSAGLERYPRLNIHRPKMAPGYSAEVYGHTVGFACNMFGEVGKFTGYTECGDVDCSGITGATEEEKNMIHDALVSGTYL